MIDPDRSPYPGLRPFTRAESNVFFGRDDQIDELLRRLDLNRFVAVIGESGCGKSSLVRAGLIAALEAGFLSNAGARWMVGTMRPGSRPIERLLEVLRETVLDGTEDDTRIAFLRSSVTHGPSGLTNALQENEFPADTNFLLLVDQFEEIFRISRGEDRDQADAFVNLLLESISQQEVPIYVVITMRSDFLGDTAAFIGLPEAVNRGIFLTPRLTRAQRREAIVGPARVYGGDLTPDLLNNLLNEMAADRTKLPQLQHLLMRMWAAAEPDENGRRVLTQKDYENAGGLQKALNDHAEEIFTSLDKKQKRIAKLMFSSLFDRVASGETRRSIRHPISVEDVARVANASRPRDADPVSAEEVIAVADRFRSPACAFVMPPSSERIYPNTMLDISHESLMFTWQRLATWTEDVARLNDALEEFLVPAKHWRQEKSAFSPHLFKSGARYRRARQFASAQATFPAANQILRSRREDDHRLISEFIATGFKARRLSMAFKAAALLIFGLTAFLVSDVYQRYEGHRYNVYRQKAFHVDDAALLIKNDVSKCLAAEVRQGAISRAEYQKLFDSARRTHDALERAWIESETDSSQEISSTAFDKKAQTVWNGKSAELLEKQCSRTLARLIESQPSILEAFVTDKFGFNVCMSGRTSDYVQIDEQWWVAAANLAGSAIDSEPQVAHAMDEKQWKDNIVVRGDVVHLLPEFDASAENWGVPISFPIIDETGFVGVTKVVFDLGRLHAPDFTLCDRKQRPQGSS